MTWKQYIRKYYKHSQSYTDWEELKQKFMTWENYCEIMEYAKKWLRI